MEVQLADLKRQLDETCATTEEMQRSYDCLKEEYLSLKRLSSGPRRERLTEAPGQQHLFDDGSASAAAGASRSSAGRGTAGTKRKKGHGRRRIPEHLPRTEVPHDVPPEERVCGCGREKVLHRRGRDRAARDTSPARCRSCGISIRSTPAPAAKTA